MERDYHIQISWENGTWTGLFSKPEGDFWFTGLDKLMVMLEEEAAFVDGSPARCARVPEDPK